MKAIVIYKSVHHGNTKKIAQILANELGAQILEVDKAKKDFLEDFDLIGFGSGIYMWRHHRQLLNFVDELSPQKGKKAFIFSTSGARISTRRLHRKLREKLLSKGFEIVGEFNCPGWDTVGPLKIFGGINKGRPNEKDFNLAREFAKKLKNL